MPTVWTMHSAFALALVTARLNASCLEEHNKREGGGGGGGGGGERDIRSRKIKGHT